MVGRQTLEQAFNIAPLVSTKMQEKIELWTDMYEDNAPWLKEASLEDPTMVVSLGLPAFIASEKARMAVLELQSEITAPTEETEVENPDYFPPTMDIFGNMRVSGQSKTKIETKVNGPTERAEYMNKQYQDKLLTKIRTQLEYGIAKGSLIIKPYVVKKTLQPVAGASGQSDETKDIYEIEFDFIQADCFYPFSFDSNGQLKEVAFVQTKVDKDVTYTRLEYHKLKNNKVEVINKAYEATTAVLNNTNLGEAYLGKEIPLATVPEWSQLPQRATVDNVDRLLFGYFKMPEANTVDPHSPLGISGFARAETLIREADKQFSRLLWEYEGGELAIDIDRDALTDVTDFKGNKRKVNPKLQARLFRPIDLGQSETYKPYNPSLRDGSYTQGLNTLLMRIEDVCALSRGTISDAAAEARTATEIKILKQRSYSSNAEIQHALETALNDSVYAMNVYCTLYNIVGDVKANKEGKIDSTSLGLYDVSFTWDDSILVDVDTELGKRLNLMQNGLTSKEEVRMWYFGETQRQAREALERIKNENQAAMEENMAAAQQMGQELQGGQGQQQSEGKGEETQAGSDEKKKQIPPQLKQQIKKKQEQKEEEKEAPEIPE